MGFEQDIFISYAHIDDQPLREGAKGWISNFHRALEIRVAQLLGEKPKIWRDPKLQGNDFFGDEIMVQFPKIAALVSILTPRYVNSKWCVKEVEGFVEASHDNIGLRLGNKARIFKVIKTPIDRKEHPSHIQGLLGYDFYLKDPESGRVKELDQVLGPDMEQAYWSRLDDLAHDVTELLKELKASKGSESASSVQATGPAVYLADATYELKEQRELVKRHLQEHGYQVYPDKDLSLVAPELQDQVKEMLANCELSIHMVGSSYGIVPEATQHSIPVLQNAQAAISSEQNGLKRLIWIPPEVDFQDDRQASFVKAIKENDDNAQAGADILQGSLEDLKFAIDDFFDTQDSVDEPEEKAKDEGPAQLYLICDQEDFEAIADLEDFFFDQGLDVIIPAFDGEEEQIRQDHQENLKMCQGCLIYYGAGNELWMRAKSRELLKIMGYGRTEPLKAKGVYLAPPSTPRKQRFRSLGLDVIDGTDGLNTGSLQEFVNQLKLTS